ncbi:gasdermin Eb isoform X2 [Poecilia reticulata]|uniref:gasdermin Eb isoform X2 n=1 Tax=Poecilia reticulata TaxID=8081 RepID=UPI0004A428B0|nr:PREDICTED: non-syndromic hearing impairment protein 5 isoform X2 [Poecilia reticulata]
MFAIATKNFVKEVDDGGLLIPVSSLNDNMELLTVVVKHKRSRFWQKPKYLPTDFTLNDLLTGDSPITPTVLDIDFIKYSGTYGGGMEGSVDASFAKVNLNVKGEDSSKLQSSFGSLKKDEVDVPKLMRESKGRVLDMSHSLIQQTKEKQKNVFAIVKERIVTTQPCSVIEVVQQRGLLILLTENGKLSKDSNVTMEIPPHTTIAYGIIELEIKNDGQFELCVMSGGGFEVDGHSKTSLLCASAPMNNVIQQELEKLKDHFQQLSTLPASTRSSLLHHITGLMQEPAAVCALQNVLDRMCLGKKPSLDNDGLKESQQQSIQAILEVLEQSGAEEPTQSPVLTALHLVVSALEELPDDCLPVLSVCCNPATLQTLELLVQCVSGTREASLSSTALPDDDYEKTGHIFASCNVSLQRDSDVLRVEIKHEPGNYPLILCIAIKSLASLACGC